MTKVQKNVADTNNSQAVILTSQQEKPAPGPLAAHKINVDKETQKEWYHLMFMTREMDDRASRYIRRGMGWSYHARCGGHEGIQLALGLSFRKNKDFLFPYYRDMGTAIGAGITPYECFLNGLSRAADPCSGGRHMSNHFGKPEFNIENVSSCTGNHTLHGAGVARALKYYETGGIAFTSQGDSSTSEGYCYEAYNGASREQLPVIFVIQNNGYGISVPTSQQTANERIGENYLGLKNLNVIFCDGTDIYDSWNAMQEAIAYVESGAGPAMVSAKCVRMGAHSNSDAHELYRTKDEISYAQTFDPVLRMRAHLLENKICSNEELETIEAEVNKILDLHAAKAEAAPKPTAETNHLYVTPPAFDPIKEGAVTTPPAEGGEQEKLREAINRTLHEEFERNPDTFMWGQDVASKDKGGVFNLSKGMLQKFGPKRIFNGPIAEDYIVGTANGMCRFSNNMRVVIEAAQFADYVWPAMEQIVETSHEYWRSNGQYSPNIVCRLASGGYITGGIYHSQNVEAIMAHLPGVRVVYPAFADDAAGLLRTSIRSQGLTFFLEPKFIYNRKEARTSKADSNFAIPFGEGRVRRSGEDLSIITYGNTVHFSLTVAENLAKEGYSVEVFDLRSIKPIDEKGIIASVKRTGKVLIVHEDHMFNGIGSEVSAIISENCFMDLDAPIKRVCAKDIPIGFSPILEVETLPNVAKIQDAALDLLAF